MIGTTGTLSTSRPVSSLSSLAVVPGSQISDFLLSLVDLKLMVAGFQSDRSVGRSEVCQAS